eukprot:TRINITY_DN106491_c0_g1_i1.p1 TRINITY_DN106491_c0_g1~~TRINITY_DN106491_c0_g1_i1.p1  ORF type:complete len:193 (+),score=37.82 TRINITY_DN106491_c0_g1_i1:25-603(+)
MELSHLRSIGLPILEWESEVGGSSGSWTFAGDWKSDGTSDVSGEIREATHEVKKVSFQQPKLSFLDQLLGDVAHGEWFSNGTWQVDHVGSGGFSTTGTWSTTVGGECHTGTFRMEAEWTVGGGGSVLSSGTFMSAGSYTSDLKWKADGSYDCKGKWQHGAESGTFESAAQSMPLNTLPPQLTDVLKLTGFSC